MKIVKERTRIIFYEYNDIEKKKIEDIVGTEEKVFTYEDPDGKFIAYPPGMLKYVMQIFPGVTVVDRSDKYWEYAAITPVQHNAQPRNQLQTDFINFVMDNVSKKKNVAGILSTGTGKTFMACYCAIKTGLRTLIITPTSSIKAQWGETLTGMFKVDPSKVLVVTSPKQFFNVNADFVIVSQASLASLNKTYDLEKLMKVNKFGIKVIDEVQMWFHNIIKVDANSNICHNWYITGTFGRSGNEENALYQKMFGELEIFREKEKEPTMFDRRPGNIYGMKPHTITKMVWAHSGISKEELAHVNNSIRYSERSEKWVRYGLNVPSYMNIVIPPDGAMTKFLTTILKVIKQAEREVTYGKTLVVGTTIANALVIKSYCEKMFPDKKIGTIHSRQSKEENNKAKAECDMIVSTTSSCGTGFDWKGLAKLINVAPFASWILADQLSGRLRRRDDGRDTYMWDIVDADVKQLRAWANSRADVERRKSKSFKVVDM